MTSETHQVISLQIITTLPLIVFVSGQISKFGLIVLQLPSILFLHERLVDIECHPSAMQRFGLPVA